MSTERILPGRNFAHAVIVVLARGDMVFSAVAHSIAQRHR